MQIDPAAVLATISDLATRLAAAEHRADTAEEQLAVLRGSMTTATSATPAP